MVEYRKTVAQHPDDAEYRSKLRRAELKAADYCYQKGQLQLEKGNIQEAIAQFQQGLAAMPDHGKLQQAMASAIARNEAANLYQEGLNLRQAGKPMTPAGRSRGRSRSIPMIRTRPRRSRS